MAQTKLVQMRLLPNTLEKIDNIAEITHNDNKSQIVATSVAIGEVIIKNIKAGNKIMIERNDGTREVINVIGI
jgi:ADP-ribosylglycohydrolase